MKKEQVKNINKRSIVFMAHIVMFIVILKSFQVWHEIVLFYQIVILNS